MGTEVEILRLDYEFRGAQQVSQARAALGQIEQTVRGAAQAFREGKIQQDQFFSYLERARGGVARHQAILDRWTDSTKRAGISGGNLSRSALMLGQTLEDMTYNFAFAINNFPMLFQSLGGKFANLAGPVAILGAAFLLARPRIEAFFEQFRDSDKYIDRAIGGVERLKTELQELERRPTKVKVDIERSAEIRAQIERAEKAQQAGKAALDQPGPDQAAFARAVADALAGSGEEIRRLLKPAAEAAALEDDPELRNLRAREQDFRRAAEEAIAADPTGEGGILRFQELTRQADQTAREIEAREATVRTQEGPNVLERTIGAAGQGLEGLATLIDALSRAGAGGDLLTKLIGVPTATIEGAGQFAGTVPGKGPTPLEEQGAENLRAFERGRKEAEKLFSSPGFEAQAREDLEKNRDPADMVRRFAAALTGSGVAEDVAESMARAFVADLLREAEGKRVSEALAIDPRDVERQQLDLMQMAMKDPEAAAMMSGAGLTGMGGPSASAADRDEMSEYYASLNLRGAAIMQGGGRFGRWAERHGLTGRGPARTGPGGHFAGSFDAVSMMGAESFAGQIQAQQGGADQAIEQRRKILDVNERMEKHMEAVRRLMDRQQLGLTLTA